MPKYSYHVIASPEKKVFHIFRTDNGTGAQSQLMVENNGGFFNEKEFRNLGAAEAFILTIPKRHNDWVKV